MNWGGRCCAPPAGPPRVVRHRDCGGEVTGHLTCDACGATLTARDVFSEPGPGAPTPPLAAPPGQPGAGASAPPAQGAEQQLDRALELIDRGVLDPPDAARAVEPAVDLGVASPVAAAQVGDEAVTLVAQARAALERAHAGAGVVVVLALPHRCRWGTGDRSGDERRPGGAVARRPEQRELRRDVGSDGD